MNQTLTVTFGPIWKPYVFSCAWISQLQRTRQCLYPGMNAEAISLIFGLHDVPYRLKKIHESTIASGLYEARRQMFVRGEADSAVALHTATALRQSQGGVQFSRPVPGFYDEMVAVTTDKAEGSTEGLDRPFKMVFSVYSRDTWFCIAVLLLLLRIFSMARKRLKDSDQNAGAIALRHWTLAMLTWLSLFLVILSGLYQGGILTDLLIYKPHFPFNNLHELVNLVADSDVLLYALRNTSWLRLLSFQANSSFEQPASFKRLRDFAGDKLRFYDDLRDLDPLIGGVDSGQIVFITTRQTGLQFFNKLCGLRLVSLPELGVDENSLVFSSDVSRSLIAAVDDAIVHFTQPLLAIADRYDQWLTHQALDCAMQAGTTGLRHRSPLDVEDVMGALLLLLLVAAVAGVVCLVECTVRLVSIYFYSNIC